MYIADVSSLLYAVVAPARRCLRLPSSLTRPGLSLSAGLMLAVAALPILSGCNLLNNETSPRVIARPATLAPEADAFRNADMRRYTWFEEFRREGKDDSLLGLGSFQVTHAGHTVIAGESRPLLDVSTSFTAARPAPVSLLTRLGFRPTRVHVDPAHVPDPGPSYPFPETPALGWRFDTTVNDLRFVRHLQRVETIVQSGVRHQTWAFAESTWWAGTPAVLLGTGTTWMGATGLVKHQSLWPGYAATVGAGTLVRTLVAP